MSSVAYLYPVNSEINIIDLVIPLLHRILYENNQRTKGHLIIKIKLGYHISSSNPTRTYVPASFLFRDCTRKLFSYKLAFLFIINTIKLDCSKVQVITISVD